MTPEPSKQLRDIAPAKVPDPLMDQMHEANDHLHDDRVALENATGAANFEHTQHVGEATEKLRKTEREIEEIESKIRDAIHPPGPKPLTP